MHFKVLHKIKIKDLGQITNFGYPINFGKIKTFEYNGLTKKISGKFIILDL